MVPGPLRASPPETDQVTGAAPPPVSVAVNFSTDEPLVLAVLQPVQFVSMELAPGVMEKVAFEGSAVTPPPAQPATASMRGGRIIAVRRRGSLLRPRELADTRSPLRSGRKGLEAICTRNGRMLLLPPCPRTIHIL